MTGGVRSNRWRTSGLVLLSLAVVATLTPAPSEATPGVPPDITGIASSDQDIDPGETRSYDVNVVGYDTGGTWTFSGTGLTATVTRARGGMVRLNVVAEATAAGGPRALTVTNPDGLSDTFPDAITVTGDVEPPATGPLTGHVFVDTDANGILDAGETGLEGVTVVITDISGATHSVSTDSAGDFSVAEVQVGAATVNFTPPPGFSLTTANSPQVVDVIEAGGETTPVGYAVIETGEVSGHVFLDEDENGVLDAGEIGLAGVVVEATDLNGSVTATTTDSAGDFVLVGIPVGSATVTYTKPPGYVLTTANDTQAIDVVEEGVAADPVGYAPISVEGSPNFVVIVTDDQRWDTIGRCTPAIDAFDMNAGADACMPNLQSDLAASGVTFFKGEVTQSLCCPSRASILTGQYTTTHGVTNLEGQDLDDSSTVATWLDDVGYRTGMFGKYLNGYGEGVLTGHIPPGWHSFHSFHGPSGQDDPYDDYPWINWDIGDSEPEITRYSDADSTSEAACAEGNYYSTDLMCRQALDFLAADATLPFLLYLGPVAPHSPNTPPDRHVSAFPNVEPAIYPDYDAIPSPNPPSYLPSEPFGTRGLKRLKIGLRTTLISTLAVDDMIGEIHDALEADGRLFNTVWVFISDNGSSSGEHRVFGKECEYWICHRVPFVVACPPGVCGGAIPGTQDFDNYALNIDIAPTIAELAGATPTIPVDGMSLVPLLTNTASSWRTEWFLHENGPLLDGIVAVASDGDWYKYVEFASTGEVEMFNLADDPYELVNLAGNPDFTDIEQDLASRLADHLAG